LEEAMQDLGYIDTIFGFEAAKISKTVLQITKTLKLYNWEEGQRLCLMPQSTQILAIKELREHLAIGLKDAKDITDTIMTGGTREVEFTNYEGAEKVADALRRSGYFEILVVRR
jgi:ribosomal protein L7/L12